MSVQPATNYYAWQVEVFLTRTLSQGYNPNFIDVIGAYDVSIDQSWLVLQQAFPAVRFFFYKDTREDRKYPPSIQSHILTKHWLQFPELKKMPSFFMIATLYLLGSLISSLIYRMINGTSLTATLT